MSIRTAVTTPTKTGVTAAQVASDVSKYGGVVVAILSVLANVPGLASVFHATGAVQGVVDAVIAVVTAIFSIKSQQTAAAAAAHATALASATRSKK